MSKNITSLILFMTMTFNNMSIFAATAVPKSAIKDKTNKHGTTPGSRYDQSGNKRPKIDFGLPSDGKMTTDTASLLTAENIKPFAGFTSRIKPHDSNQTDVSFKMLSMTGDSDECLTSGCRLRQMLETASHKLSAQDFLSPPKINVTITY